MGNTRTRTNLAGLLALALGLGMLVVTVGDARAQDVPNPVVEAARQVSADPRPARLYPIPSIEVDPTDAQTVVVGAAEARFGGCRLYVSRDGGLTWLETAQDMLIEPYDFCVRRPFGPIVEPVFTQDGKRLYVGFGGAERELDYPNGPLAALMGVTENLGLDVETTVVREPDELTAPEGDTVHAQHEMSSVAVDPTDNDVVYRGWRRQSTSSEAMFEDRAGFPRGIDSVDGLHSMVAISTDGGATWAEPVDLTREWMPEEEQTEGGTDLATLVTAPDGTVHAFSRERRPRGDENPNRIVQWRSSDQGATWEFSAIDVMGGLTLPDVTVDQTTGDIHLAYEVSKSVGEGEDAPSVRRVEFITSSDGGDTWSDPVDVIDPDFIEGANQYFPGIDVAPNGRIDITWWDFRDDPFWSPLDEGTNHSAGERYANIYYAYSTDGGATWSQNIRVNDRLIDVSYGVAFPGSTRGPISVASADGAAYVAWSDTRAATDVNAIEDVYMTRVRMSPDVSLASASAGGDETDFVDVGLGAAIALVVGGLLVLMAARRRRPAPAADKKK